MQRRHRERINPSETATPVLQSCCILESHTVTQPWMPAVFNELTSAVLLGGPKLRWWEREKESEK